MNVPDSLRYTDSHEWVRFEAGVATIGCTDYAQDALSDVTFVEAPEAGRQFAAGEELGAIESCKAASAFYAPLAGKVLEANEALADDPGLVNRDCYGQGWLAKLAVDDPAAVEALLTSEQYRQLVAKEP